MASQTGDVLERVATGGCSPDDWLTAKSRRQRAIIPSTETGGPPGWPVGLGEYDPPGVLKTAETEKVRT